eukprot:m.232738 g.232738  ORF g.232738 m.232738 type:complete len:524 (+) comp12404_c0_seq1:78-1649(+)
MVQLWAQLKCGGTLPAARTHTVFATDGKNLYLFGGACETGKTNDMFQLVLDGKTTWRPVQQKGDVPSPRDAHAFVFCPATNLFYLFGGSDNDDKSLNDLFAFDPSSSTWKLVKSIDTPLARSYHAMAVNGSSLYLYGGFQNGISIGDLHVFDIKSAKWTALEKGKKRCNHTMNSIGKNLVVFGGRANGTTLYSDVALYDTAENVWVAPSFQGGEAPAARDFHSACVNGKSLIVFGGAQEIAGGSEKYFNDVYELDTDVWTWSAVVTSGPAPAPRLGHAAAVVGTQMVVFGGSDAEAIELADVTCLGLPVAAAPAAEAEPAAVAGGPPRKPPVRKPVPVPPPPPEPPKFEATAPPNIDYGVPTAVPAARRIVEYPPIAPALPRDLDKCQRECNDMVSGLFRVLRDEFVLIDTARLEISAMRDAFLRERAENEALFARQQTELAELHERHKRETEEWISQRRKENDEERLRLADERLLLKKEQEKLKADTDRLAADRAALEAKERTFDEKSKKLEAVMAQFKGIA